MSIPVPGRAFQIHNGSARDRVAADISTEFNSQNIFFLRDFCIFFPIEPEDREQTTYFIFAGNLDLKSIFIQHITACNGLTAGDFTFHFRFGCFSGCRMAFYGMDNFLFHCINPFSVGKYSRNNGKHCRIIYVDSVA